MKKYLLVIATAILSLTPRPTVAQIEIPDTIPGKGNFIGQLNLAKRITNFLLDIRDSINKGGLTYLMALDVHVEIGALPVGNERRMRQPVGELGVYCLLASRLHLEHVGEQVGLEYPVPVQLLLHGGSRLVRPYDIRLLHPPAYLLVGGVCLLAVLLEYVLNGSLAYLLPAQV